MKKIVFVRHAKSSWKYDVNDLDRPLKNSGIIDVNLVSKKFKSSDFSLENVFTSPAKRALETCDIFVKNLDFDDKKIKIIEQLYDFGGYKVIDFIKSLDNNYNNIMIFGHNHALTSIVNTYGNMVIDNLPTCGLAVLEFDIDYWKDLVQGQTLLMIFPRDLRD